MNCSLIIEESLHEQRDTHQPLYIAFLDGKSAFDVVNRDILMRKLYHMGVEGAPWLLIRSLHEGSATAVEWEGSISEPFQVHQGVKQEASLVQTSTMYITTAVWTGLLLPKEGFILVKYVVRACMVVSLALTRLRLKSS